MHHTLPSNNSPLINMNFEELNSLSIEAAIARLDVHIAANPGDEEALTLRGMRHWAMNHRSKAINDYLAAIRINPSSRAVEALRQAQAILDFYNKDLLNP